MPVSSDTVVVRDEDFTATYLDGKVVVLNVRVGSYFNFNKVGTEIWDMLTQSCRIAKIFDELLRRYEVDQNTLAVQVSTFLEQLAKDHTTMIYENVFRVPPASFIQVHASGSIKQRRFFGLQIRLSRSNIL